MARPPSSYTTLTAFPLDLTQDALRQRGIAVDTDGFCRRHGAAEGRSARASWAGSGDAATETVWFSVRDKVGATEFPRL